MKFAFAILILVSLTAVSSQYPLSGTWYLDWQTQNSTCAPSSFTIAWNTTSNGYNISYTYPYNQYCPNTFNTSLTLNSAGAYVDIKGQTLNYFSNNNTIFFVINSTLSSSILFSQNGDYLPQSEVAALISGVWTSFSYNANACQNYPPSNISITVTQSHRGINSPTATYYYSTFSYNTVSLVLSVPQLNQPVWTFNYFPYGVSATISYTINPATNQTSLQFQVSQSSSAGTCIGTSSRSLSLFSGTWYPDWQDGDISDSIYFDSIPTSIQVINNYNLYMSAVFNFNNSAPGTATLYPSATGYTDSEYGSNYNLASLTFMVDVEGESFLYSQGGSVLSVQSLLGKWSDPVVISYPNSQISNASDYCCLPETLTVSNYTGYTLSMLFHFNGYTVDQTNGCYNLKSDVEDTYYQSYFNIQSPNASELIYVVQQGQGLYTQMSLNNSQLQVVYSYNGGGTNCTFVMSSNVQPPSPLSAHWIAKGISVFVFLLIVTFI